jgi:hypothetical protein
MRGILPKKHTKTNTKRRVGKQHGRRGRAAYPEKEILSEEGLSL